MTDYLPLLSRAVSGLEPNSGEVRRAVYDRARQALVKQLRAMNPPLAESEITRERLALEEAIRRIETQAGQTALSRVAKPPHEPPRMPTAASIPPAPPVAPPPPAPTGRERSIPAQGGARLVRDAVAEADQLGITTTAAAQAARVSRDAIGGVPPGAFELDEQVKPTAPAIGSVVAPPPASGLGAASQPRPFRPRPSDFAKLDARKALKAKLIVGGIVAGLLLIAGLIGYLQRDRILASIGLGAPPQRVAAKDKTEGPKSVDRVAPDPSAQTRPTTAAQPPPAQPTAPSRAVAAVAQRAVLYEENPGGGQQLQTFVGTAVWRTETVNPGPGRPPDLGVRVEVEIPDRRMTVTMTIRRNPDTTLPASHTVEVQFTAPGDPFGGVASMPGIRSKSTETAQGVPLTGIVARVMPGFFLIGLSAIEADRERNIAMLRERSWLDLPFVYNNGRRAVLVLEKGTPGERAMNEAITAWGG